MGPTKEGHDQSLAKDQDQPLKADQDQTVNIIKCRDDYEPIYLHAYAESDGDDLSFKLAPDSRCSWADENEYIGTGKLRERIEPWLTALCQSEHLSLLAGSGLTHAVHKVATGELATGMVKIGFETFAKEIEAEVVRSAAKAGRGEGNIEDQLRAANELLRGLEIVGLTHEQTGEKANSLRGELQTVLTNFTSSLLSSEHRIITAQDDQREEAFNYLVSFLMSFASRSGTRDRLHIFTTNYDRVLEAGAEVAGLHFLDRFVGSLAPIFRSSRLDLDIHYNPPGIRGEPRYLEGVARFTKLHGSIDWLDCQRDIRRIQLPLGAEHLDRYLIADGDASDATRLMIYPNSAKDRETAQYPYVELFRDLAAAVCRPNHTLITFGYGFGDEHINRVIEDMLTIPSTHLVAISYGDPLGRIMAIYERLGRHPQISLLIGNHIGEFQILVDHYLPKPAIDRTTFKMSNLLKARWGSSKSDEKETSEGLGNFAGQEG